jgi:hypothetical protein
LKTKEITVEVNEEVKSRMLEYLQQFESGVKSAAEFSAEQAPLVVQEFLAWEFWGAVLLACGFLLASMCSLIAGWLA